uniref:OTU domain-containing protein n=1 Tax=Ditylenchus dipsaci TaxID=166011 RepID=A0A915CM47_9BILA
MPMTIYKLEKKRLEEERLPLAHNHTPKSHDRDAQKGFRTFTRVCIGPPLKKTEPLEEAKELNYKFTQSSEQGRSNLNIDTVGSSTVHMPTTYYRRRRQQLDEARLGHKSHANTTLKQPQKANINAENNKNVLQIFVDPLEQPEHPVFERPTLESNLADKRSSEEEDSGFETTTTRNSWRRDKKEGAKPCSESSSHRSTSSPSRFLSSKQHQQEKTEPEKGPSISDLSPSAIAPFALTKQRSEADGQILQLSRFLRHLDSTDPIPGASSRSQEKQILPLLFHSKPVVSFSTLPKSIRPAESSVSSFSEASVGVEVFREQSANISASCVFPCNEFYSNSAGLSSKDNCFRPKSSAHHPEQQMSSVASHYLKAVEISLEEDFCEQHPQPLTATSFGKSLKQLGRSGQLSGAGQVCHPPFTRSFSQPPSTSSKPASSVQQKRSIFEPSNHLANLKIKNGANLPTSFPTNREVLKYGGVSEREGRTALAKCSSSFEQKDEENKVERINSSNTTLYQQFKQNKFATNTSPLTSKVLAHNGDLDKQVLERRCGCFAMAEGGKKQANQAEGCRSEYYTEVQSQGAAQHNLRASTSKDSTKQELEIMSITSKYFGELKAVRSGENEFRKFRHASTNKDKKYFVCYHCSEIKKKSKELFTTPTLQELDKQYTVNEAKHHAQCKTYTKNEVLALDLDRKCRQEVRTQPGCQPQATYDKYADEALKVSLSQKEEVFDPSSVAMKFGSYEEVRQQLFRHRREGVLTVEDAFDLPAAFRVTKGDAQRWLLLSDREAEVVVLSSDADLITGAKCKYLAMDSTFEITSNSFYQLLTLHGLLPVRVNAETEFSEWVVIAFALMKKKSTASYEVILNSVVEAWKRLSVEPMYKRVFMDFEESERNAAMKILGANKIKGCQFHHAQAVLHKIKNVGLIVHYRVNEVFRALVRSTLAISLLPPDLVDVAWESVKKDFLELVEERKLIKKFVNYFEAEWMRMNTSLWNWYREDMKTNNAAEAFHSFLKRRHGALRRPGNSLLFAFLQKIQYGQATRVVSISNGAKVRKKNKKYERIKQQLWNCGMISTSVIHSPAPKKSCPNTKVPKEFLDIEGDGNCLYRSIAYYIKGTDINHGQVRQEMMDYLHRNKHESWAGIFGTQKEITSYIKLHRQESEYGYSKELILAAKLYQFNFVLFKPDEVPKFAYFSADYTAVISPACYNAPKKVVPGIFSCSIESSPVTSLPLFNTSHNSSGIGSSVSPSLSSLSVKSNENLTYSNNLGMASPGTVADRVVMAI